jgi:hypothetical protein
MVPMRTRTVTLVALAAALLSMPTGARGQGATPASAAPLALTHIHVVDVREGVVLPDRTVVIVEGRIASVEPAAGATLPPDATVVDATGAWLVPGFWDMHAHLRGNGTPPWFTTDWLMPLAVAHGVTGVREMNSECDGQGQGPVCLAQMQGWRAEIDAGTRVGPRLVALSSFLVNPPWDYEVTEAEARGMVQALSDMGVENLKIYDRLSPDALRSMADEARAAGLGVWGHVPLRMTVREASDAGLRSVEHARDLLFDCFPGTASFRRNATSSTAPVELMRQMVDAHDPAACDEVFRVMVRNDTWYVPTHVTRRRDAFAGDATFRADPRVRFIVPLVQADFEGHMDRTVAADSAAGGRTFRDFYRKGLEVTGAAHRAGVRIMVGSDAPDPWVFPGSAVHDEMGELVAAGLTPAEALRAATWNGAEFLGRTEDHGSVEVGKVADLVLLDANPLERIDHVRRIRGVILGGRHLDRDALDDLLAEAETAARQPWRPGG